MPAVPCCAGWPCSAAHVGCAALLRRCCVVSRILQPRLRGVLHHCTYRRSDACRAVIGLHIAAAHSALCHDSYHGSHPVATVYLRLAAACVAAYKHSYAQRVSPVEQPLRAATANRGQQTASAAMPLFNGPADIM